MPPRPLILSSLLLAATLSASAADPPQAKLPYTIAKETTGITAAESDFDKQVEKWTEASKKNGNSLPMNQQPGELRDLYAERIAHLVMVTLYPSLGRAEYLRRVPMLEDKMIGALLSAAQYKAKNGNWPTADQLPAAGITLPTDILVDAPVKYSLTPNGPRIYSVGEKGRGSNVGADVPPPGSASQP